MIHNEEHKNAQDSKCMEIPIIAFQKSMIEHKQILVVPMIAFQQIWGEGSKAGLDMVEG